MRFSKNKKRLFDSFSSNYPYESTRGKLTFLQSDAILAPSLYFNIIFEKLKGFYGAVIKIELSEVNIVIRIVLFENI